MWLSKATAVNEGMTDCLWKWSTCELTFNFSWIKVSCWKTKTHSVSDCILPLTKQKYEFHFQDFTKRFVGGGGGGFRTTSCYPSFFFTSKSTSWHQNPFPDTPSPSLNPNSWNPGSSPEVWPINKAAELTQHFLLLDYLVWMHSFLCANDVVIQ